MLFATIRIKPTSAKIITSYLQRAHQTAICISQGIGGTSNKVLIWPTENDWNPSSDLTTRRINLLRKIAAEEESREVIVVGHFNYLNETLAWEVGQDAVSLPDAYGAVAFLSCKSSFEKGTGALGWPSCHTPWRSRSEHPNPHSREACISGGLPC